MKQCSSKGVCDEREKDRRHPWRVRLHRCRTGAPAAAPSQGRDRAAHRGPKGRPPDLVFCALPHATTQKVLKDLLSKAPDTRVVDLSADFRLEDPAAYAKWYGHEHHALELQKEAVYGPVGVYRREIKKARLVANPGCYTA